MLQMYDERIVQEPNTGKTKLIWPMRFHPAPGIACLCLVPIVLLVLGCLENRPLSLGDGSVDVPADVPADVPDSFGVDQPRDVGADPPDMPTRGCSADKECEDDNPCTMGKCVNGHCVVASSRDCCAVDEHCDDLNLCTEDTCVDLQCAYEPALIPECACISDGDCAGNGGVCGLFQPQAKTIETYCMSKVGDKDGGAACNNDEECQAGFCLELDDGSICFGGCKSDDDCAQGSICGQVNFKSSEEIVTSLPACVFPGQNCDGDKDCSEDDVCLPIKNPAVPDTLLTQCLAKQEGSKTAGQNCGNHEECQTGICVTMSDEGGALCWSACQEDADCMIGLHCYENMAYFRFDQDTEEVSDDKYWGLPGCAPYLGSHQPCWADSECPEEEFCHTYASQTFTELEPRCSEAVGDFQAGTTCAADSECKSNWCFQTADSGFCVGLCNSSEECAETTTCQSIDMTINDMSDEDESNDIKVDVLLCLP